MDRYSYEAYGRIRLFLADLNIVLGSLPYVPPSGTLGGLQPTFNNIGLSRHLSQPNSRQRSSRNRPTRRSKAWKKQHAIRTQEQVMTCPQPHNYNTTSPIINNDLPMTTSVLLEPALVPAPAEDTLERGENDDQDYAIEDPETVSQHQGDWEIQSEQHDLADEVQPEASEDGEKEQETQTTCSAEFNINDYSFGDMQRWASNLPPEEFERLRYVDNATRIDCFRQHILANLDQQYDNQPTQPSELTPPNDFLQQPESHPTNSSILYHDGSYDPGDGGGSLDVFDHDDGSPGDYNSGGEIDDFDHDNGGPDDRDSGGGFDSLIHEDGGPDDCDGGGGGFDDFDHEDGSQGVWDSGGGGDDFDHQDGSLDDWDGGGGFDGLDDTANYAFEY